MTEYIQSGNFKSKSPSIRGTDWSKQRLTIKLNVYGPKKYRMTAQCELFFQIHDKYEPCAFWEFCKNNSKYKRFCQTSVKLISLLFCKADMAYCETCGQCYSCSLTEHMVLFCNYNENTRRELWTKLLARFGCELYLWFISLSAFDQVVSLLSTFKNMGFSEKDKQTAIRIVIFALYKMIKPYKIGYSTLQS